jgi:prepilin-type N-terminal cleavage/methylation domain-containing protein
MREDPEGGFTLIELLLVTAIVGVVVPAIAGVLLVFFRTAYVASVRTDRAHDANLLGSYLPADLASTRTAPTLSGPGCNNSMQLSWSQQNYVPNGDGTADNYVATYAVAPSTGPDGPYVLRRTAALNGGTPTVLVMAHNLDSACSAVFSSSGNVVTVAVTQFDNSGNAETSTVHFSGGTGGRS